MMLIGLFISALTCTDFVFASPQRASSTSSCTVDSPSIGSLLQREYVEFTDSSRSSASNLLHVSSVGMDLGANLSPKPWQLLELGGEDLFMGINMTKSLAPQMKITFDSMAQRMNIKAQYTDEELTTFKEKFAEAVAHDSKVERTKKHGEKLSVVELKNIIKQEMILQQPIITDRLAKRINTQALGWVAGTHSHIGKLTLHDFESSLGYRKDDAPVDSQPPEDEEVAFIGQLPSEVEIPESFDAREGWPECAQIIGLVPEQGRCASCWALTSVSVFNDRLCIASGGAFNSQLSAADVLACSQKNYGCKGGNPAWAVEHLQNSGTVTGASYDTRGIGDTCFPYPVKNTDSTKHFTQQVVTPECRNYCPERLYPRDYAKDKYYAAGRAYMIGSKNPHADKGRTQDTWDSLKKVISAKGSVMMMYAVGRSHVAYEKGFWDCPAGKPNHMARCFAYGVDPIHGKYVTCAQSWGKTWGEDGLFRMQYPGKGCLEMFMSIPVNWKGRNMKTGVPPSITKGVMQSVWGFWRGLR